jgi:hypothetical protein
MTETYQCQTCGEVTTDGKCGCVTDALELCREERDRIYPENKELRADNAALRKVLEVCRDHVISCNDMGRSNLLYVIEQTLSKGKTE